jgi:hypothetical protein
VELAAQRAIVCEDCCAVRLGRESGWVQIWLETGRQPPVLLTYCPGCAEQFAGYPDEVSPILGE